MSAKLKVSVAFYLLFLNVTPVTVADILHPIEGGEIVARISRDGDTVILKTLMGQYRYPSSDFRSIISTRDPQKDWPNEQEAASAGSAVQCCETALWALDRGLISECDTMIREANRKDPTHQPSSRMVAVLDRLKAPCKDPDRSALLRNLPTDHRVAVGPHVLLFHQHSDQEASERLEILETVTKAYYLYFASIGIDLPPPKGTATLHVVCPQERISRLSPCRGRNGFPHHTRFLSADTPDCRSL